MNKNVSPFIRFFKDLTFFGLEAFNLYYSKYRGIVYETEDPKGMGRLKLIIPEITGTDFHDYWAYPANSFSGKGYGVQCLPRKGDMVWVEFEKGHVDVPIWNHGHFGQHEVPTEDKELDDTKCYWFVTPGGHKIKLNDTTGAIHIESRKGNYVEVNDQGISSVADNGIIVHGNLNTGKYSHVLGEEIQQLLTHLINSVNYLESSTASNVKAAELEGSSFLGYTSYSLFLPFAQEELKLAKAKLDKILSSQIKLQR